MDHLRVRVAETGVVEHQRRHFAGDANETSLFLQLADCTRLDGLIRVQQTGRDFNTDSIDWRPELLLQQQFGSCSLVHNGNHANTVAVVAFNPRLPRAVLPIPQLAEWIYILDEICVHPFGAHQLLDGSDLSFTQIDHCFCRVGYLMVG